MTVPQAFELALQHQQTGRLAEAETLYRQILASQPKHPGALHYLGVVAYQVGRHRDAVELISRSIALDPTSSAAYSNLGAACQQLGRPEEAMAAFHRALELQPDLPQAYVNLANVLGDLGKPDEAAAALRRALDLNPRDPITHYNHGNVLNDLARPDEAILAFQKAAALKPDYLEAWSNLGSTFKEQGRLEEAVAAYRHGLDAMPGHAGVHSNLVYLLHFCPAGNNSIVIREHERWNQQFAPRELVVRSHGNNRDPERRLRIGYFSPDFRDQVVGRNLLPLFKEHDHRSFEIVCYSRVTKPDRVTAEIRRHAELWRDTEGLGNQALAEMVREDGVDILVDLSQHLAGNRLPVFVRQPAPVQASFAGYPESTGVEAIGYRISDRWLEPPSGPTGGREGAPRVPHPPAFSPDARERMACLPCQGHEERVFLIESFWCYDPCGMDVKVNELPARQRGQLTFGCLNNFCKINEPMLRLWARVLREVAAARLMMLSGFGSRRQRTLDLLEGESVESHRVEFVEPRARQQYLGLYHQLDLMLDTYPYNGHTTSLDALWMGVPVVSLAGERPVSRAGLSQLSNLGLPELVAHSEDEFVTLATRLASDLPRLAELRCTLRPRMETSVLMDAPRFARCIEAAYRVMWREWCARKGA